MSTVPTHPGTRGVPPKVGLRAWATWVVALAVALPLFYVVLTPVWIGIRVLAWVAEFRSRRRRPER